MPHRPSRTAAPSRRSASTDISSRPPAPPPPPPAARAARVKRASRFRTHPRSSSSTSSSCQPRESSWAAPDEPDHPPPSAPPALELSALEHKHFDHLAFLPFDASASDLPPSSVAPPAALYELHPAQDAELLPTYPDSSTLGGPVGEYDLHLSTDSKLVSDPSVLQDVSGLGYVVPPHYSSLEALDSSNDASGYQLENAHLVTPHQALTPPASAPSYLQSFQYSTPKDAVANPERRQSDSREAQATMQSFHQHSSYNMHHAHPGMKVPLGYGMPHPESPSILNHASQPPSYPPIQPTVPSQSVGGMAYSPPYQAHSAQYVSSSYDMGGYGAPASMYPTATSPGYAPYVGGAVGDSQMPGAGQQQVDQRNREKSGTAGKSYCPRCGAEFTRTTAMKGHMNNEKCKPRKSEPSC